MTTPNDKHLEKHEQKGGDQPLAGAQITKAEDSAVKQRQEMLDGLKSHRITKEGNASFVIDMGNGDTVQDVRAAGKVAADAKASQGILPGEGDYMPKPTGDHSPPYAPDLPGKSDVPTPGWPPQGQSGHDFPSDQVPQFPPPGVPDFPSDKIPQFPPPGMPDFPIPGDLSKLTVKTDTTIDKQGHIVTTETRADGSSLATTQEIGGDGKLHPVETTLKERNGDTTTDKLDPVTGKKTEETKDTVTEKTDTKYNANEQPTSIDTTNKLTGKTDHEDMLYFPSGELALHLKNDKPVLSDADTIETLKSKASSERGIEDPFYLKTYKDETYDTKTHLWTNKEGKVCDPPPPEAYATNKGGLENMAENAVREFQQTADKMYHIAYVVSHLGQPA